MIENLVIRPIEMKDAQQFRDNLYTRNNLEEIKALISENLQKANAKKLLHLVAELNGEVVGTAILVRNPHVLRAHRAEIATRIIALKEPLFQWLS